MAHLPLFSARSSWSDVRSIHLYPRESLRLALRSGQHMEGKLLSITDDRLTLRHALQTSTYLKAEIATIDYIRSKPTTDSLQYLDQEAPYLLLFHPEFYYRASGLPGRLTVRLYDASLPENNNPLTCRK